MPKLVLPRPPAFHMDERQIEKALSKPITRKIRRELVLPEETEGAKKNGWNRVVAAGMENFQDATGMPVAALMRQLLVLYFTGNLNQSVAREYQIPDNEPELVDDSDDGGDYGHINPSVFSGFPGAELDED